MLQNTFANISKPFANKKEHALRQKERVHEAERDRKKAPCLASLKWYHKKIQKSILKPFLIFYNFYKFNDL